MNLRQEMYKDDYTNVSIRDNHIFITKENLSQSYTLFAKCKFQLDEFNKILKDSTSTYFSGISITLDSKSWCRIGQRCIKCSIPYCEHKEIWQDKINGGTDD